MKNIFDCQKATLFVFSKSIYNNILDQKNKDK